LKEEPILEIRQSITGIARKEDQVQTVQQVITLELVDREYPHENWIHAYTDGSAVDAIQNGGSGVYIRYPDGSSTSISKPTGKICTNIKAEATAINLAVEHLIHAAPSCKNIAILKDSLSTALALESKNTSNNSINILKDSLLKLTQNSRVVIQLIPTHCGIPGNDKADLLAKDGSQQQQDKSKHIIQ
jgi:ribonuclease HI